MKLRLPHRFQAALMAALASLSFTTLSSATAYAQDTAAAKSDGELGLTLFMGDSITNGVKDMTYRWQLFKTFVDNGVYFSLDGPISGYDAKWLPSSTTNPDYGTAYRGVGFVNNHYGRSSGRSGEMISGDRYGYKVADVGNTYDIHTGTLLIGTNDLLSDTSSGAAYSAYAGKMQGLMGGTVTYSADKDPNATWTWTQGSTMGNLGTIIDSMNLETGENFYVLSVPAWGPHGNHTSSADHAAVRAYNTLLQEWVAAYDAQTDANVKYVEVNTGLVDMTSSTAFFGNKAFFNNGADGLHPSEQGSLIMAGNVARAMGIGGRTAGLSRSAATGDGWSSSATPITFQPEDDAQTFASGKFSVENGYTVDFTATFGNGSEGGWLDPDKDNNNSVASLSSFSTLTNSLNIQVGDGTHTGTLKLAEGYVAWSADNGDMVLYCQNNSVSGNEALRIAYREADSANNILGGYYVWKGDMLIGQGLASVNGSLNGITLSITGTQNVGGTISNLSWADTAYAPTTELFSSTPLPNHDNPTPSSLNIDFDGAKSHTGQYATGANAAKVVQTSVSSSNWFAPVGANHSGDLEVEYKGITGPKNNMFGIIVQNGSITETGNVSVVIDGGSTLNQGGYDSSGDFSIIGSYQGSITQKLSIEINEATLTKGVMMGVVKGTNSIGAVDLRINSGASIGGDVIGGNHSAKGTIGGNVDITITGGSIAGSVYGGNMDNGTISGNTNVVITGGIISGGVYGGNKTGGTLAGTSSVTIDGNLPYIGGNITADTVTLTGVNSDPDHSDTFDKYRGTITADAIVLDNYQVDKMLAKLVTQSLTATGGTNTVIHNLHLTACEVTVAEGSSVTLADSLTLGNTATYTGNLTLQNGLVIDMVGSGGGSGYSDGENGFREAGNYTVMQRGASGSLDVDTTKLTGAGALSDSTFTYDSTAGTLTAAISGETGTYFVNSGTVVYGGPKSAKDITSATTTKVQLQPTVGATLELAQNLTTECTAGIVVTSSAVNPVVRIDKFESDGETRIVLAQSQLTANGDVKLAGNGTFALNTNSFALPQHVSLDDSWTGAVRVSTNQKVQNFILTPLANPNSWVEFNGVEGWTNNWYDADITQNIILTNNGNRVAWLNNADTKNEGHEARFTGKWAGSGTLQTKGNKLGYKFSGDISEWTGTLDVVSGTPIITFAGNAKEVNANISATSGVQLKVETDATFNGNISGVTSGLTVANGHHATFTGTTGISGASVIGGTVYNDGAMTLGGTVAVNAGDLTAYDLYEQGSSVAYSGAAGTIYAGSGYLTSNNKYYLIKNINDGSLTNTATTPTAGVTLDKVEGGLVFTSGTQGTVYYVNNDLSYNAGEMQNATSFVVAANKTFTAAGENFNGRGLVLNEGSTLKNSKTTYFAQSQISNLRLDGNATVNLDGKRLSVQTGGGNYSPVEIALNGNTLNVTGTGNDSYFGVVGNATVDAGTIALQGTTKFMVGHSNKGGLTVNAPDTLMTMADGTSLVLAAGNTITLEGLNMVGSGTPSASIAQDGTSTAGNLILAPNAEQSYSFKGTAKLTSLTIDGEGTQMLDLATNSAVGQITVNSGTMKLGSSSGFGGTGQAITVNQNGVVDLNGKADANYTYTLNGGTLTNSGSSIGATSSQTKGLVLTADSTVDAGTNHDFRLLGPDYSSTSLQLGGKTLNKTGDGLFGLKNTTVNAGTINVEAGTVNFDGGTTAANIAFDGGNVTGTMNLSGDIRVTTGANTTTGANIVAGNHRVSFDGSHNLIDNGTISGAGASVVKEGEGSLTLSGSNGYTGGTTINAGTLVASSANALGSGDITVNDGGTLELTTTVSTGDLSVAQGGTLKLAGVEGLTSTGTLNFGSGAILDLTNIHPVSSTDTFTLASATGISGSLENVTLANLAAPSGYKGVLTQDSTNLVLTFTPQYDGLIWNATDGNWSNATDADKNWHTAADTTAHLPFTSKSNVRFDSNANNRTVTLTENIIAGDVEIMDGVTVTIKDQNKTLNGTLKGSGTYALASGDSSLPGSLNVKDSGWTGTVKLTSATGIEQLDLNTYGHTGSKVELSGVAGYLKNSKGYTYEPRMVLTGDGLTITNGYSDYGYIFAGGVEGDGDFKIAGTTGYNRQTYTFTGDVSNWTGTYESTVNKTSTLKFYGQAREVGAEIKRSDGVINVEVGDGSNAFSTIFDQAVSASSLEIKANAGGTFEDTVTVSGALKLDANTTSHFKGNVTAGSVAVGDNQSTGATATFDGTLTVSGAFTMNGTTAVPASVALNGDTTVNGNFDLSNGNKAHGTVTVAANKTLDLNGAVWMNSNSTLALGQGATAEMGTSISLVGLTGGGTVSSSANAQFALNSDSYTVDHVKATFNTGNDNVQLKFTNSQIESAQHVTLKNAGNTLTSTTVTGDTLTVAAGMDLGTVTVSSGAELALTSSGVTIGSGSIASGATLKLSDSPFSVASGEFSLDSGSILDLTSWTSITGETPITLGTANGGSFSTAGLSGVEVHLDPSIIQQHTLEVVNGDLVLTFTQPEPTDYLVWQGGPGYWNTESDNKVWYPDEETTTSKVAFEEGKSVAFMVAGDSPVTVADNLTAGNIRVDEGVNLTLENNADGAVITATKVTVSGNMTAKNVALTATSMQLNETGSLTVDIAEGVEGAKITAAVSGSGDFTKTGEGNLALTGNNSGFTGTLTIKEGAVVAASSKALGNTPDIVLAGGNLAGATGVTAAPTGDINITSTQDGTVSANMQVASDSTLTFNTTGETTITESGVISGSGSIVKDGTGTLVLANNNTYTGNLNINQGTVLVSNVGALGGEGSQRVNVSDGATLSFVNKKDDTPTYTADYIAVARGASLTFAGTDKLDIGTLSLDGASAVDLSNIVVDHYGEYVLADVHSLVTPEQYGILSGDLVEFVSMKNFKPVPVTEGEPWSFKAQDLISLHYKNNQLILDVHEANPGFYWIPSETTTRADWNTSDKNWSSTADLKNPTLYVNQEGTKATAANSVYFLNPGGSGDETIDVEISGGYIYVRDFIIANGVYNFTTDDGAQKTIKLDENRLSNFVVRSGAEAHFTRLQVDGGMNDVTHVCKDAVLTMDEVAWMWGEYSLNNEGYYHVQGEGYSNLMGHVDNSGTMEVLMWSMDRAGVQMLSDIQIGTVMNREGANLTLFAYSVSADTTGTYGDGILHNEGSVTLGGKDGLEMFDEMSNALPVMGNGTLATVGDDLTVYQMEEVQQTSTTFGAMRTELAGGATIGDVKLKANTETAFGPHQQLSEYGFPTGVIEPMDYTFGAVRAETGSTMEVQKGATVVIDGFNADLISDSPTGKIVVGPYNVFDEDLTMTTASLKVNGITKAAELEVQDGGVVDLDGYATVTTLTQSGGTANFNAGGYVDGGTVSGGTLHIADGKVLTLGHAIDITENGSYTVAATSGSINADALTLEENMDNAQYLEAVSLGETKTQSGFLEGGQQYVQVFNLGEGATLEGNSVTVTHKDAAGPMTLDNTGRGYLDTTDPVYSTYYVRDNYVTGDPGARGSEKRSANYVKLSNVIEASKGEGQTAQLETVVFDTTSYNEGEKAEGKSGVTGSITVDLQGQHADLFDARTGSVGVVNIGDDASGDRVLLCCCEDYAGVAGKMKIAGTGIYQIENRGDLGTNVSLLYPDTAGIDHWTGTVRLIGAAEDVDTALLSVGSGDGASEIEFYQWHGSFLDTEDPMRSNAKILLTGTGVVGDPAITLTEGDANLLWTNTVSGEGGRIDHSQAGDFTLTMTGDTHAWDGTFNQAAEDTKVTLGFLDNVSESGVQSASVLASAGTMDVTYGGNVKTVNGNATVYGTGDMNLAYTGTDTGTDMQVNSNISKYNGQGTMNVTVGDGTNKVSATFNGGITADTLTVETNADATLHNTTEISDIVEVEAGASLSIQNTAGTDMATITSGNGKDNATITDGVTMKSDDGKAIISGTAGEEWPETRVAGADVAVLGAAASLQIENLVLAADTMVHGTGNVGRLVISDTVVQEMSSVNAKQTKPESTITTALTMTGTTNTTLEYDKDNVYNVDFTSMCQMAQISGSAGTLVFDFTAMPEYYDWEDKFSDYGFVGVNFDIDNLAIDASDLTVTALTKDAAGNVVERIGYYNNGGNGAVVGSIIYFQVPEPTTSTLSLLALMALAARRRRK